VDNVEANVIELTGDVLLRKGNTGQRVWQQQQKPQTAVCWKK